MDQHNAAVAVISSQVRQFSQAQTPFRLYHGSTNSTQHRTIDRKKVVDTSRLNHILHVDKAKKTCLVEPNVAMDELVAGVLEHGLLPPVVPEFPGITVGGAFAGTAGESSCYKYGFFDHTVNWIEFVLPTGEVVVASPTHKPDLFSAAAGSLGTLGVATMFEIQLITAKPYVELTYRPAESVAEALDLMDQATKDPSNDFVDGILLSMDRGVIVTGILADRIPNDLRLQRFSRAQDPWFYIHADRLMRKTGKPTKEMVPIQDYLFRYDRGAFWTGKYAFQYFITPFNRITRWALDYFMHTRVMYHALHASGHASKYIIQDLLLPRKTAEQFVDYVNADLGLWPLWICPMRQGDAISMRPDIDRRDEQGSFVNIGVWGPGPSKPSEFFQTNRRLEDEVRKLGGIKWLYAQTYYTEDEFWSIYDRKWYDDIRAKYHAAYLPSVYDKVRVDPSRFGESQHEDWAGWLRNRLWNIWPVSGLVGVCKVLIEREYLLQK